METTQWFSYTEQPAHEGLYQRRQVHSNRDDYIWYAYWSNKGWSYASYWPIDAVMFYDLGVKEGDIEMKWSWRGLTEKAT